MISAIQKMKFATAVLILNPLLISVFIMETLMVDGAPTASTKRPLTADNGKHTLKHRFAHPTNRKKVVLMCYNTYYLIFINNIFQGSVNPKLVKKYGKFEMQLFGVGYVRIFNVRAKKYLAVDKKGKAYATKNTTMDTLFRQTQKHNSFLTFHSLVRRTLGSSNRRKWYLAIKKDGRLKRPSKTLSRHRSTEFLVRDWGTYKLHLMNSRR